MCDEIINQHHTRLGTGEYSKGSCQKRGQSPVHEWWSLISGGKVVNNPPNLRRTCPGGKLFLSYFATSRIDL